MTVGISLIEMARSFLEGEGIRVKGRAAGTAAWEEKRRAVREKAIQQSTEIRHDVQNHSDAALDRGLDRWMRDWAASSHAHAIADVTSLQTALDAKAASSHAHAIADVTGHQTALDAKVPLALPALTGIPTALTAANGTNTTQLAITAFVLGTRLDQLAQPTAYLRQPTDEPGRRRRADDTSAADPLGQFDPELAELFGHLGLEGRVLRHLQSVHATSSRILAPDTRSASAVNSAELWLMPPFDGTKIMAAGATLDIICAS